MSVEEFLTSVANDRLRDEALRLAALMQEVSGHPPAMWGTSIVGFDTYHYKYASGREGDYCVIGFSPRGDRFAIYLMDGVSNYERQLAKLGKHKTGKACLYVKSLADVDLDVLREILDRSYRYTKSHDGTMHRAT